MGSFRKGKCPRSIIDKASDKKRHAQLCVSFYNAVAGLVWGKSAKYSKISTFKTKEFAECSRNLSMYFL